VFAAKGGVAVARYPVRPSLVLKGLVLRKVRPLYREYALKLRYMEYSPYLKMFPRTSATFAFAKLPPFIWLPPVRRGLCLTCSTSTVSSGSYRDICGLAGRGWRVEVASRMRNRPFVGEIPILCHTRSLICASGQRPSLASPVRMSGVVPDNEAASPAPSLLGSDASTFDVSTGAALDEFNEHIRTLGSKNAVRKLTEAFYQCLATEGPFALVDPDPESYRLAVRSLVRSGRSDLGVELYKRRMTSRERRPEVFSADVSLGSSLLRALLRDGKKRRPVSADIPLLFRDLIIDCCGDGSESSTTASQGVNALSSLIVAFLDAGMESRAVEAVKALEKLSRVAGVRAALDPSTYNNAIRLLGKRRRLDGVFGVLDAMREAKVSLNNETFEFLANSAVRQVEFVTGAVSMETLPPPLGAEIAFVGRSNVGKSSLVNMICNRRALAYVSGRPGKTQQFNYFLVNGGDKQSAFYLVDLPGVGYAKVPRDVQAVWLRFMDEYLAQRTSLAVVFHLIDGRHGPQPDDELLMNRIANCRFGGQYVAVLTKVDKLEKQKVRNSILDGTRAALNRSGCSLDTPILLTSSETRLGRDDIWRYLQKAISL
jgi:GTP-binding protein